jgi:enoyl-CoA hydratase/carnithine racemase
MTSSVASSMSELLVEARAGIVWLTLNRPERRNALSRSLVAQLQAALRDIAASDQHRVVVLAASGGVFCAGHDLSEMVGRGEGEYRELFGDCTALMLQLRRLPQIAIARVQGLATAAGCQLAASCDLIVAAEEAAFAAPGVKIGLFCTTPMVSLVRAIPAKPALEMLLTGEPISAQRAWQLGLVNRVAPREQLDAVVEELSSAIQATSPAIVRLGKAAFYDQLALDEVAAYQRANDVIIRNALHADAQEGIAAFLEKRRPDWSGR